MFPFLSTPSPLLPSFLLTPGALLLLSLDRSLRLPKGKETAATQANMHVLCKLYDYRLKHIPQAFSFTINYYLLFRDLNLFLSHAMLMRPKKAKTALHSS